MRFQKGNKFSKGGTRGNKGGRPTKEEVAKRESLRQMIERKREEEAEAFQQAYFKMAKDDPATMRHFIDKVIPPQERAPQQSTHIDRVLLLQLFSNEDNQDLAERMAKLLTAHTNGSDTTR
jgi:hypothetical protein